MVIGTGEELEIGGPVLDSPGYDLLAAVVGSEGTLGIVTEVVLRILRKPESTQTFFATFPSTDEAGAAVSGIIAAKILPAAIEMMDPTGDRRDQGRHPRRLARCGGRPSDGCRWPGRRGGAHGIAGDRRGGGRRGD